MQSPKWLQYRKEVVKQEDGSNAVFHDKVEVETAYTRVYHNAIPIMMGLPPLERSLLDYLCAIMSKSNYVVSNEQKRKSFMVAMKKAKQKCTDGAVIRAFGVLVEKGLLLKAKRGSYQVNPEYFMKNKADGRDALIKKNYENNQNK